MYVPGTRYVVFIDFVVASSREDGIMVIPAAGTGYILV